MRITLEDVTRADVPATIITKTTIRPAGNVPIPFSLEYDPAEIDSRYRYAVRAQIRAADGRLRWTSTALMDCRNHVHVQLHQITSTDRGLVLLVTP